MRQENNSHDAASNNSSKGPENGQEENLEALRKEIADYGEGPPSSLEAGSAARVQWFEEWLEGQSVEDESNPIQGLPREHLRMILERQGRPELMAVARAQGLLEDDDEERAGRPVQAAGLEELQAAVEKHPVLR